MNPVAKETRFDRVVIGDSLARVHAVAGRAFVVALDGPGGSGKSTLAREVVAAYDGPAAVVEGDDFYADLDDDYRAGLDARGGYREYFDWQRLRDQVFLPARQGRPVSYQRYDWGHARMGGLAHRSRRRTTTRRRGVLQPSGVERVRRPRAVGGNIRGGTYPSAARTLPERGHLDLALLVLREIELLLQVVLTRKSAPRTSACTR